MSFLGCSDMPAAEKILFDFESDEELDQMDWRCRTLMSLSREHVTHGKLSVKLELFPAKYPGMNAVLKNSDWRGYSAFCFDIYNPGEETLSLVVWIDDGSKNGVFTDRFNEISNVGSGWSTIAIPLEGILTRGTKRRMDLSRIYQFGVYLMNPEEKTELYVDYIRLVK
jgi:hypothetical protein